MALVSFHAGTERDSVLLGSGELLMRDYSAHPYALVLQPLGCVKKGYSINGEMYVGIMQDTVRLVQDIISMPLSYYFVYSLLESFIETSI